MNNIKFEVDCNLNPFISITVDDTDNSVEGMVFKKFIQSIIDSGGIEIKTNGCGAGITSEGKRESYTKYKIVPKT